MWRKNKAQTILEYAVLIGVVAAALVAMKIFMQRALQDKYRQSADTFGEGGQYEPGQSLITNVKDGKIDLAAVAQEADPQLALQQELKDLQRKADGLQRKIVALDADILAMRQSAALLQNPSNAAAMLGALQNNVNALSDEGLRQELNSGLAQLNVAAANPEIQGAPAENFSADAAEWLAQADAKEAEKRLLQTELDTISSQIEDLNKQISEE